MVVRSIVSKIMQVEKATVFLVGLAVILASVFGVASATFGANGDFFNFFTYSRNLLLSQGH